MKQKQFVLVNKGMNRDLSVSKAGESSAYTNLNIRIEARDFDTLLSVTNERGTKQISLGTDVSIVGTLIGWNVLNNHIILFTHNPEQGEATPDRIYRIDYDGTNFHMVAGEYPNTDSSKYVEGEPLFTGNLGFSIDNPIESVVYHESDAVQKIYWVDGKNVLRFMNFAASLSERNSWDDTSFDSNRVLNFNASVSITKDNSGVNRPNGTVQYLMTYYNKHGQESGYAWISDIVYLSPSDKGGAADGTNANRVVLAFSNLDTTFTGFRLYSMFRSSLNGTTVGYLVAEANTSSDSVTIVDDGAHLETVDASSILYLGSRAVIPGTMAHKDQTLFLGDLQNKETSNYSDLEKLIRDSMISHSEGSTTFSEGDSQSSCVTFLYSDWTNTGEEIHNTTGNPDVADIPYVVNSGEYPYNNQLKYSSSQILSFKGGEKYRFGLKFQLADGTETKAFWIGDKENNLYPVVDYTAGSLKRIVANCVLPEAVVSYLQDTERHPGIIFKTARLLIAEATYADRSVKAQGIVNPTVFNTWERYKDRVYSMPSWVSRPRGGDLACGHFSTTKKSLSSKSELQCSWWDTDDEKHPFFQYKDWSSNPTYLEALSGAPKYSAVLVVLNIAREMRSLVEHKFYGTAHIMRWKSGDGYANYPFSSGDVSLRTWTAYASGSENEGWYYKPNTQLEGITVTFTGKVKSTAQKAADSAYDDLYAKLVDEYGLSKSYIVSKGTFSQSFCVDVINAHRSLSFCYPCYGSEYADGGKYTTVLDALNANKSTESSPSADRWSVVDSSTATTTGDSTPAFYKKQLMFVDENVLTLDSPELTFNAVSVDNADYKFRIVGAAKISSVTSDYLVSAAHSGVPGEDLDDENFSGTAAANSQLDGLSSWPLWKELGLDYSSQTEKDIPDRSPEDYTRGTNTVYYWLHMWHHSGIIDGFRGEEEEDFSRLQNKIFANRRFSYSSIYFENAIGLDNNTIRHAGDFLSDQISIKIGEDVKYYSGSPKLSLTMPGSLRYPLWYSTTRQIDTNRELIANSAYLYSKAPVLLEYGSGTHAVIPLNSGYDSADGKYVQDILPALFTSEKYQNIEHTNANTGALLPWVQITSGTTPEPQGDVPNVVVFDPSYISVPTFEWDGNDLVCYDLGDDHAWFTAWKTAASHASDSVYALITATDGKVYLVNVTNAVLIDGNSTPDDSNPYVPPVYPEVDDPSEEEEEEDGVSALLVGDPVEEQIRIYEAQYLGSVSEEDAGSTTTAVKYYRFTSSESTFQSGYGTLTYAGHLNDSSYIYRDYVVNQEDKTDFDVNHPKSDTLTEDDQYLFIGEIYKDFSDEEEDTRYGGITISKVEANRFINAGPAYRISEMNGDGTDVIFANQGDTYFQRWDDLRIKPSSSDSENAVVDIVSAMLETHINVEGRSDSMRGIKELASVDAAQFNILNPVYSQNNNSFVSRDLDEDFNTSSFPSSITWTLPKANLAQVDAWTHITLANILNLDSDKGICRALRRFGNSLFAFQDRAISEVLFNSRTQLSTQDGVPVEIANSGKVDGKSYISNQYGCINKWSITEGKSALYFVDNINKAFCVYHKVSLTAMGVESLSDKLGFSTWFRAANNLSPWTPNFNNFISFYDRIHSDVYLVRKEDRSAMLPAEEGDCLVFNETLGAFTSFYSYGSVPMMANVEDKFISFKGNSLWEQNAGKFGSFFGVNNHPFSVRYRVTPDPYGDKIWTNLEYRADFYNVLDNNAAANVSEQELTNDADVTTYVEDETFSGASFATEYQHKVLGGTSGNGFTPKKKFRIWHLAIPRASASGSVNPYGLDRFRNPWIEIGLNKDVPVEKSTYLCQLHDVIVTYYE